MENRHPEFPTIPTFRELDIDMVDGAYHGIAVPSDTPVTVQKAISALFSRISQDPEAIQKNQAFGLASPDIGYDALYPISYSSSGRYIWRRPSKPASSTKTGRLT